MTKQMILIRGHSGSGKTTLAHVMQEKLMERGIPVVCLETDNFFVNPNTGGYKFDGSKLKEAHKWCKNAARMHSMTEVPFVIVSNTFTQHWEMDEYMKIAEQTNRNLLVVRCEGGYKNVHGVPDGVVEKQKARFEDWPGEVIFNGNMEDVV